MNALRLLVSTLAALLVLAACAPAPAAKTVGTSAPPSRATFTEEMSTEGKRWAGDSDSAGTEASVADNAADNVEMAVDDGSEVQVTDNATSGSDDEPTGEKILEESHGDNVDSGMGSAERPAWQQIALTDARTGERFTLAGYADTVVFVEPFATWCSNCRRQLGNVQTAHARLAGRAVFVALSVEPNIAEEKLASYAEDQGFTYTFAAMPPEMLQELASIFGQTVSNPPATPHFIIRPDGSTTELVTGFEDPEVLEEKIRAAAG